MLPSHFLSSQRRLTYVLLFILTLRPWVQVLEGIEKARLNLLLILMLPQLRLELPWRGFQSLNLLLILILSKAAVIAPLEGVLDHEEGTEPPAHTHSPLSQAAVRAPLVQNLLLLLILLYLRLRLELLWRGSRSLKVEQNLLLILILLYLRLRLELLLRAGSWSLKAQRRWSAMFFLSLIIYSRTEKCIQETQTNADFKFFNSIF